MAFSGNCDDFHFDPELNRIYSIGKWVYIYKKMRLKNTIVPPSSRRIPIPTNSHGVNGFIRKINS